MIESRIEYVAQDAMTEAKMNEAERMQTRLVSFDPLAKRYCIVSGVKSDQEKREQHARELPLCVDAALYWERAGNKKNAADCRILAALHTERSLAN
jgi:hypothetical protein